MQLPYGVRQEEADGHPVYVLEDLAARAEAWVVPGLGLNAYHFAVESGGHEVAIIDSPATLEELHQRPSGFGLPILFPFPGRVAYGRFAFRGQVYEIGKRAPTGHAIHGFVLDRPWQVIAAGSSEHDGAVLVGRFESRAFPELASQYPSHFRLDVTFRLRAWTLSIETRAENVGASLLPVGLGLHPYFRVPLHRSGSVGGCIIEVPVTREWGLAPDLIPTGRLIAPQEDLTRGVSLEGRRYDNVYTGVIRSPEGSRCVLADTKAVSYTHLTLPTIYSV